MDFFPFDDDYVRRLRDGDRLTEDHFVSYILPILRIKVRNRLSSREAEDDAVQETLVRVFRMLRGPTDSGIRNGHSLGAYVVRVCDNVIKEGYRRDKRTDPLDDKLLEYLVSFENTEDDLIKEQQRECVRRVVSEMDERDKKILTAIYLLEQPKAEVCKEFGVDQGYLRVLLHRAREKFRKAWEEEQKPHQPDPDETDPPQPSLPN
jgi:RNA polymerase sigma-70 factor, ECF subfamily